MISDMKKITSFFMACLAIVSISSCKDTLDTHPTSSFDEEIIWSTKETINTFIIATSFTLTTLIGN